MNLKRNYVIAFAIAIVILIIGVFIVCTQKNESENVRPTENTTIQTTTAIVESTTAKNTNFIEVNTNEHGGNDYKFKVWEDSK